VRIRDALVIHERLDGALEARVGERLDVFGRPAEPGVCEQMCGAVVVPRRP
jgi:hypothetical protein